MWYDLETNDPQRLAHSRTLLNQWLRELPSQTNIPLAKTFLLGFSQGAAMTLEVGLSLPLGGLISLSGYWHGQPRPGVAEFPAVLIVHGRLDQVVPLAAAGEIRQVLDEWGVFYQYEELAIGHEITPEVLDLVHNFIVNCTQSKG
jgi:phospholipase/carboxylesterase